MSISKNTKNATAWENPHIKVCKDCQCELGERGKNHDHCARCIAAWHAENEIDDDVPCGDFDDGPETPEY